MRAGEEKLESEEERKNMNKIGIFMFGFIELDKS